MIATLTLLVMIAADIAGPKLGSTAKFESCRLLRMFSETSAFGSSANASAGWLRTSTYATTAHAAVIAVQIAT